MEAHRGPNNNEVGRFKLIEKLKRKGVSKIFAANGCEHVVATTRNGKCYTYGFNAKGQLGHGITNTSTNVPKLVEALSKKVVTTIGCSYYHTIFACDDKTIYACGRNDFGQLGIGNDKDTAEPLPIKTLRGKEIVSVGCGQFHSIVVTKNGEAYTFGKNDFGQLGLEEGNFSVPQQLMLEVGKPLFLKMISCGYYHSAGITTEGELYTWGRNQSGQLGLGVGQKMVFLPRKVSTVVTSFEKVACGCYHTLVVSQNKLYAFGRNRHGQLGDGTTIDRHSPVEVEFKGGEILQVAAGFYHSVVLSAKQETNSLSIEMLQLFESGKYSDIKFKVQG